MDLKFKIIHIAILVTLFLNGCRYWQKQEIETPQQIKTKSEQMNIENINNSTASMTQEMYQLLKKTASKYAEARLNKNYKEFYNLTCDNFKTQISEKLHATKMKMLDQALEKEDIIITDVQLGSDKEFLKHNAVNSIDEIKNLNNVKFAIRSTTRMKIHGEPMETTAVNVMNYSYINEKWCLDINPDEFKD